MATFQRKTIDTVINPLIKKLSKNIGYKYPTLGHFYREIEILKFPYMASYTSPRNIYGGNQYDSIVKFLEKEGIIQIHRNTSQRGYLVEVKEVNPETLSIDTNTNTTTIPTATTDSVQIGDLQLTRESHTGNKNPNCWELVFYNGEELSLRDLKTLNERGYVYHSEQTDIDYETEDGVDYMNIYYFAKIDVPGKFFYDCVPF